MAIFVETKDLTTEDARNWYPFIVAALVIIAISQLVVLSLIHVDSRFEVLREMSMGILAGVSIVATAGVGLLARNLSEARAKAWETSRHDLQTGLLNHGSIVAELHQLPSLPGCHALVMTDVDGLKRINDLYGHIVGDHVLLAVAECLSQPGAVVGRYGGDEFLSILRNASRGEAEVYREKVTSALREAAVLDSNTGNEVPIQVSLGIAIFPDEATAIEDALSISDEAMYARKRQRPVGRVNDPQKYELGIGRLVGILGAMGQFLSDRKGLENKMDDLAHRLLNATGSEGIVFILWPRRDSGPVARSALASTDTRLEPRVNSFFESISFDERPIWQQLRRSGQALAISNLETDDRLEDQARELARAVGIRSILIAPLNGPDGILGALYIGSRHEANFGLADRQFFQVVAEQFAAIANTSFLIDEIKEGAARLTLERESTVMKLAAAAEAHDPAVGPHQSGVRHVAELIAGELGLSPSDAHEIGLAAALHDVGKLYVAESLLASTEVLTTVERRVFEKHTYLGSQFLSGPGTELASIVAQSHHEHWDGGGYPDGLRGEEIPEAAAITSVADALDSITTDRSYQRHRSLSTAIEEISSQSGKQFSPKVVKALMSLYLRGALGDIVSDAPTQLGEAA
jgi:diguanylate cyclase (GGDEF)-like protein